MEKQTPTETFRYVYDFNRLVRETDDTDDPLNEYTFAPNDYGNLLSEYRYDDNASGYPTFNALGTTENLLDESEGVSDTWKHTAFGLAEQHTGTSEQPFTFIGKQGYQFDQQLELYLLGLGGNRAASPGVYDPHTGQFVRKDPIGPDSDTEKNRFIRLKRILFRGCREF
jgi:hypothetical protein